MFCDKKKKIKNSPYTVNKKVKKIDYENEKIEPAFNWFNNDTIIETKKDLFTLDFFK